MPRTRQPSQAVLRSVVTRRADLKDTNNTGVFYVGLGDRFDDERRLVRELTSEFRPAMHRRMGRRFPFNCLSR